MIGWRKRQGHAGNTPFSHTWYVHTVAWIGRVEIRLSRWIDKSQTNYLIEIGYVRKGDDWGNPNFSWNINTRNLERRP